jgi:hypothetical protein
VGNRELKPRRAARPRPWSEKRVIFDPGGPIASVDELRLACLDALAAELLQVATWDPDEYGDTWVASDSTFLILSFRLTEDTSGYVQFLSDGAHNTVLWEVSSHEYQPGLADVLTAERRAALVAQGFKLHRSPSNYIREVEIHGAVAARSVAEQTLDILVNVLGYRGDEALRLHVEAERVASQHLLHPDLEPRKLALLLRQTGFRLRLIEGSGPGEVLRLEVDRDDGLVYTIVPAPRSGDKRYRVITRPALGAALDDELINAWNASLCLARLFRDGTGAPVLAADISLEAGATDAQVTGVIVTLDVETKFLQGLLEAESR